MRYSANLNVIIKAIEKASMHLIRDFIELENLQSSPDSADRFARRCYDKVKTVLIDEFSRFRSDYNIHFDDGQKVINNKNPEYYYEISAINGLENLARANPNFAVVVALIHKDQESSQPISIAINNIYQKELFYSEKGFGAYHNNRKIKCSKRRNNQIAVGNAVTELDLTYKSYQSLGCIAQEIAYLSSAKFDLGAYKATNLVNNLALLFKESGGKVEVQKDIIIFKQ